MIGALHRLKIGRVVALRGRAAARPYDTDWSLGLSISMMQRGNIIHPVIFCILLPPFPDNFAYSLNPGN